MLPSGYLVPCLVVHLEQHLSYVIVVDTPFHNESKKVNWWFFSQEALTTPTAGKTTIEKRG
jgi:hypothetical protein